MNVIRLLHNLPSEYTLGILFLEHGKSLKLGLYVASLPSASQYSEPVLILMKKEARRRTMHWGGRKALPPGAPKGICVQQLTNGDRVVSTLYVFHLLASYLTFIGQSNALLKMVTSGGGTLGCGLGRLELLSPDCSSQCVLLRVP